MLYCYGDSWSFPYTRAGELETFKWPDRLKIKLKQKKLVNHSIPAGSNWRIARMIASTTFQPSDIVVISWTHPARLEFGANILTGKEKIYTGKETFSKNRWQGDIIENQNGTVSRRLSEHLTKFKFNNDKKLKTFLDLACKEYHNHMWLEDMFLLMFKSTVYTLRESKCKWVMFNAWIPQYSRHTEILEIPEYLLGYKNTMNGTIRPNCSNNFNYWDWSEHNKVADIIYERL